MEYYVADAFTGELFSGNPAGVCLVDSWPDDALMQKIAMENNLAETAFVVREGEDYGLRWFTPATEVDLCGHATLASAFILSLFRDKAEKVFRFRTKSGLLTVTREGDLYAMDFPARPPVPVSVTQLMRDAMGCVVMEAHLSRDIVLVLESEETVRKVAPDMALVRQIPDVFGVIVTAKGRGETDFVSRFFAPGAGIDEDPVTGSSHATLIPFWAERLGKKAMTAVQLSKRGGVLICRDAGDRAVISGKARLYLEGKLHVNA